VPRVLFVDDEREIVAALTRYFTKQGFEIVGAYGVAEALIAIEQAATGPLRLDVVCTDLSMPDGNGLEVVRAVRRRLENTPVVMLTAYASISTTVEAMRLGCVTILEKPMEMAQLERELRAAIGDSLAVAGGFAAAGAAGLVGNSPALRDLLGTLARVAPTSSSVLITGESGTGKELVAQAIHQLSRRAQGPLVAVNCAAIPEQLLESELFGHVKGAFTGALAARAGRFRAAHGGTLFLDEIGELPLALQSKLLRVLQDKSVLPVGAAQAEAVDFRLVAATNRNLEEMVAAGSFRSDLFYRLNVVPLALPPLRERLGDVPVLLKHFCERAGGKLRIGPEVMAVMVAHRWPGNVRELENLVERLSVLRGEGEVLLSDLPASLRPPSLVPPTSVPPGAGLPWGSSPGPARPTSIPPGAVFTGASSPGLPFPSPSPNRKPPSLPPDGVDLQAVLAEMEDRLISEALERTGGNRNQAAKFLGLNRTTLVEKLRKKARSTAGGGTGPGGGEPPP
jgi:DNA-binding NtrC family response regulator